MNIEQAKELDLKDFLKELGYKPVRVKHNSAWYLSPFRDENIASFKVNMKRNEWFDYGRDEGGGIIKLAKLLYNTSNISEVLRRIEDKAPACARVTLTDRSSQRETVPYSRVYLCQTMPCCPTSFHGTSIFILPGASVWKSIMCSTTSPIIPSVLPTSQEVMKYAIPTSRGVWAKRTYQE